MSFIRWKKARLWKTRKSAGGTSIKARDRTMYGYAGSVVFFWVVWEGMALKPSGTFAFPWVLLCHLPGVCLEQGRFKTKDEACEYADHVFGRWLDSVDLRVRRDS